MKNKNTASQGKSSNKPKEEQARIETACKMLRSLRAGEDRTYCQTLQEIIDELGGEYKVVSEEIAKGLLIALVIKRFGHDIRRDKALNALGLIENFKGLNLNLRRTKYLERCKEIYLEQGKMIEEVHDYEVKDAEGKVTRIIETITVSGIGKQENIYFEEVIKMLSSGIKEKGDEYLEEIFNYARRAEILTFLPHNWHDWSAVLPVLSFEENWKEPRVRIEFYIAVSDDSHAVYLAERMRKRIKNGEKTLFVFQEFYSSDTSGYIYKYHEEHDFILEISESYYDGISAYDITVWKVVEDGMISITLPCDEWDELIMLIGAWKNPLFIYNYHSDGVDENDETLEALKQIVEESERGVLLVKSNLSWR